MRAQETLQAGGHPCTSQAPLRSPNGSGGQGGRTIFATYQYYRLPFGFSSNRAESRAARRETPTAPTPYGPPPSRVTSMPAPTSRSRERHGSASIPLAHPATFCHYRAAPNAFAQMPQHDENPRLGSLRAGVFVTSDRQRSAVPIVASTSPRRAMVHCRAVNYRRPEHGVGSMATNPKQLPDDVDILRATVIAMVRSDDLDLTARQLAVFLVCYLADAHQTVRGLASHLQVSKPAITRALDRLSDAKLLRRLPDPQDRRSVLVGKTSAGAGFLRDLKSTMLKAAASSPPN